MLQMRLASRPYSLPYPQTTAATTTGALRAIVGLLSGPGFSTLPGCSVASVGAPDGSEVGAIACGMRSTSLAMM
jgi:hypothetical protein